jgi:hypothetical protein
MEIGKLKFDTGKSKIEIRKTKFKTKSVATKSCPRKFLFGLQERIQVSLVSDRGDGPVPRKNDRLVGQGHQFAAQ